MVVSCRNPRILDVPDSIWNLLARACGGGTSAQTIKAQAVHGAFSCAGFFSRRCFSQVRQLPWNLVTSGNIDAELDKLASLQEPPKEPLAAKVYGLLKINDNRAPIRDGLKLLSL